MNQKGYALLAVIGITALLMALSLLSFQAAQVQSISLISEGRAKASTNEAVAALSALIRTLDRPSLAQRLSPSTFLSTLQNEVCNPSWLAATYPNTSFFLIAQGQTLCGTPVAQPPAPEPQSARMITGGGDLTRVPFLLLAQTVRPGEPPRFAVAQGSFYQFEYLVPGLLTPVARTRSLTVENATSPVKIQSQSIISGPAVIHAPGGVSITGRPGLAGPVSFHGTRNVTVGQPSTVDNLSPSPHAPCMPGGCPSVDLGVSWGDTLFTTPDALRGSRRATLGVLWNDFSNATPIWPRVQVGTQRVCNTECKDVPVYDYAPEDAQELVLQAAGVSTGGTGSTPAMRATFHLTNGAVATLLYQLNAGATEVKWDSCQGCVPDPAWDNWTRLNGDAYLGHENRRIQKVRVTGERVVSPTYIFTNGDVTLEGSVRTTPNVCAMYSPTPGSPPTVNCDITNGRSIPFHLDAGENGVIRLQGLPSTILGFLSGGKLEGSDTLIAKIVGGAYLVEGFDGLFWFYHDPSYARISSLIPPSTWPGYRVLRMGKAAPWGP